MNDNDVLTKVRDGLSGIRMDTPVDEILAKARRHRRSRRLVMAGAASAAMLGLGLTAAVSSVGTNHPPGPAAAQLAAFSISSGPRGASSLTLRKGEQYRLNPVALRQALAQHDVPALVTLGKTCDSKPEPEGLDQAVTPQRHPDGSVTLTINPAAMPAGSELSIGYYTTGTTFALIEQGAPLDCRTHPNG
jgi:hypothetical protein